MKFTLWQTKYRGKLTFAFFVNSHGFLRRILNYFVIETGMC